MAARAILSRLPVSFTPVWLSANGIPARGESVFAVRKGSWMSRLKLFHPEPDLSVVFDQDASPIILSFPLQNRLPAGIDRRTSPRRSFPALAEFAGPDDGILNRARLIHDNGCCPDCGRSAIAPVEEDDAVLNRNYRPIPGTATLVGFHCHACRFEWPA